MSSNKKRVSIQDDDGDAQLMPLNDSRYASYNSSFTDDSPDSTTQEEAFESLAFKKLKPAQLKEARAAERLSIRLLAVDDDDSEEEDRVLRHSLRLLQEEDAADEGKGRLSRARSSRVFQKMLDETLEESNRKARWSLVTMLAVAVVGLAVVVATFYVGAKVVGPPSQPTGPYELIERQEGSDFFDYYSFYEGRDSVGSNGYLMYVSENTATELGIVNVTYEKDMLDEYDRKRQRRRKVEDSNNISSSNISSSNSNSNRTSSTEAEYDETDKPFIYMGSSPTEEGPRNSIRLEGNRRFNRGLFIIDLRHMPAGCGTWPAFWLTDEANWPVNGEIDIVEGVNFQSVAKTALHSTKGCSMDDIPLGTMTGEWDTATGIPNAKTGIPDMTVRYAQNCFVYDPHQWLNQGCVAGDTGGGSLGEPLNEKGGGIYALEWDPINTHIKTWVFTPHENAPENLVDAIRTASNPLEERVMPDPEQWPIPYGYFGIGDGTSCSADHFRHMRLVFNLAFCGSVSGNRFQLDCKKQAEQFDTCNEYIKSDPKEMDEAYWKIRGVYVYERQWERQWVN
jgi:hypothetical protein